MMEFNIYLFILFYLLSGIFYILASYLVLHKSLINKPLYILIFIAVFFSIFQYSFKIPALQMGSQYLSVTNLQLLWIVLTFVLTILYDYIVNKQFSMKSILAFVIICFGIYIAISK